MQDSGKILVVDDEKANLYLISEYLKEQGYVCQTALNGEEAVKKSEFFLPDLIILDLNMPVMDGYQACQQIKGNPLTEDISILIVSTFKDRNAKHYAVDCGADDIMNKPVDIIELKLRVKNQIEIKKYREFRNSYPKLSESRLMDNKKELAYRLAFAIEYTHQHTKSHINRISDYCTFVAGQMGLEENETNILYYSSAIHDIGMIGIPSNVLAKSSTLSNEEYEIVKKHASLGYDLLKDTNSQILKMGQRIAHTHHENWDGTGYPKGLAGKDIDIEGRIVKLTDVYDSLRSIRPYKPAMSHEQAVNVITEGDEKSKPSHFDPMVLDIFTDQHKKFEYIFNSYTE